MTAPHQQSHPDDAPMLKAQLQIAEGLIAGLRNDCAVLLCENAMLRRAVEQQAAGRGD